jgi:Uma2 family endonuclease
MLPAMAQSARRLATYDDLLALPDHVVGELIHGSLDVQPRPSLPHARAASRMGDVLGGPFDRGFGGPGGWIVLDEPELHLGPHVLVPDLAGWRRERLPEVPETAATDVAPNWVAEILSPSTAAKDRVDKMRLYFEFDVSHVWLVDPTARTLEILRREPSGFVLVGSHRDDAVVRAEPFDAIELQLAWLWER